MLGVLLPLGEELGLGDYKEVVEVISQLVSDYGEQLGEGEDWASELRRDSQTEGVPEPAYYQPAADSFPPPAQTQGQPYTTDPSLHFDWDKYL